MNAMDGACRCAFAILLFAACRTDRNSTVEPHGASHSLLAAPGAMDGWRCTLEVSTRFHAGPFAGHERVTDLELALTATRGHELALRIEELSNRVVTPRKVMELAVDHDRVLRSSPERREVLRRDENAEARGLIDALSAAPHAFIVYDEHARLTEHRSDFGDLDTLLPVLDNLELAWFSVYPQLPGPAAIGQRWWGKRTIPPPEGESFGQEDAEIAYTLRRVRDGVATIAFGGGGEHDNLGINFSYDVSGSSRVRTLDGALLGGSAKAIIAFTVEGLAVGYVSRTTVACRPPK
jgi:hypothetical protein